MIKYERKRCSKDQFIYKIKECLLGHRKFFHTIKNKNNEYLKDAEYRMEYKKKDHGCWSKNGKQNTAVQQKQYQEK